MSKLWIQQMLEPNEDIEKMKEFLSSYGEFGLSDMSEDTKRFIIAAVKRLNEFEQFFHITNSYLERLDNMLDKITSVAEKVNKY